MSNHPLYDQDFYAWTNEQAALLRAGRLSEADVENIAEEIESLGKREKRERINRLQVVLLHLLRWRIQPGHQNASWKSSIINTRDEPDDHLRDSPSLKSHIARAIEVAYRRAVVDAMIETGVGNPTFPQSFPWSFEQLINPDFYPEEIN